jgi:hypothetical protein
MIEIADDDEVGSIVEYSESIADTEKPALIAKGKYEGELREVTVEVGKEKGRRYFAEVWVIPPEAFPADYDLANAPDGLVLSYNRTSAEDNQKSRFRLKEHFKALGLKPPGRQVDTGSMIGARAMLEIDYDTYEGVEREIIRRITKKV